MSSVIMDSPALQSNNNIHHHHHHHQQQQQQQPSPASTSTSSSRHRSHTSTTAYSNNSPIDPRGAINKRSSTDRTRSISSPHAERLYRLAAEQQQQQRQQRQSNDIHQQHHDTIPPAALGVHWITPQHSPQLSGFVPESSIESFPQWTAPTPPRSESGISNNPTDEPVTSGISGGQEFFESTANAAEMSSLGFLLPSQYGASPYESEQSAYTMEPSYIPPMRMSQPPSTNGPSAYAQTTSSNPALYSSRPVEPPASSRRPSEMPPASSSASPYGDYRRTSNPYDSASNYSVAPSQTIPSISGLTQSPLPSPHLGSGSGPQPVQPYNTGMSRSPNMYEPSMYAQPYTTAPAAQQMYASSASYPPPPFVGSSVNDVLSKPMGGDSSIRVLNQRPKPQCWEHGCNGRQFSTFSNLLRHQREKSGTAAKSYCPKCGAEFTRTTARNGHLAHDKCTKQRRPSDGK